jgi:hypothetical protein
VASETVGVCPVLVSETVGVCPVVVSGHNRTNTHYF